MCVCAGVFVCMCLSGYLYTCMCVHVCMCMSVCLCICVCMYEYTYIWGDIGELEERTTLTKNLKEIWKFWGCAFQVVGLQIREEIN